jgi:membrane protein implicated in regulation of membrane protease activity
MEAKAPQDRSATVSRASYFGGLLVGGAVLAIGFYVLALFDVGGWKIPLEMAVVAVAMLLTTGIWKRSAARQLDSPIEPKDRT